MKKFWTIAVSVAGLSAVAAFVFYGLYKKFLDLPIFRQLTSQQTFILMLVFLGLTFLALLALLITYIIDRRIPRLVTADSTSLHQIEQAWERVHHIRCDKPVGPHVKDAANALTMLQTYWKRSMLPREILVAHYLVSVRDLVSEMRGCDTLVPGYEQQAKRVRDMLPLGIEATLKEMEDYATRTRTDKARGD